jgi:myb proto-oncogene protein
MHMHPGRPTERTHGGGFAQEDEILKNLVRKQGARNWSLIAQAIPGRSGKSCRLRWCNQLDPAVKKEPFSELEDSHIIQAQKQHGNKWAIIARFLPGRCEPCSEHQQPTHETSTIPLQLDKGFGFH